MTPSHEWSQVVGPSGRIVSAEKDGAILRCALEHGALTISALSPRCVKVTLATGAGGESTPSFAVGEEAVDPSAGVDEEDSAWVLRCGGTTVRADRRTGSLRVTDVDGNALAEDVGSAFCRLRDGIRLEHSLGPDEHVYGLGEKTGYLDKRGGRYLMWNTDDPHHLPGKDPLYKSIPLLIRFDGSRAWGIFVDRACRMIVDVGCSSTDRYAIDVQDDALSYYVFPGPTIPEVISAYTELTGRMAMPPKWSLGFQQCRWSYYPESKVRDIARAFRAKRIPCDAIYLDIDYMDGYRVFTWDPERFPDPRGMVKDLAEQGFKIVTIVDPGVKKDSGYHVYIEGARIRLFAETAAGELYHGAVWPGPSAFPDFTKEETRVWWAQNHEPLFDAGVAGIWNDMNEPSDFSHRQADVTEKTVPDDVILEHDGHPRPFSRYHNAYGMEMCRATVEAFNRLRPNDRPFVLTRAAYAGIQKHAVVWTGDNHSWWEHVAMAMPMHMNVGLSGVPFVGGDIGGFSANASGELFARWMQLGVFTPFCRAHSATGTNPHEPWAFGDEVEAISRRYVELRYRLLPFWYSEIYRAHKSGRPIMRPLVYDYPEDPRTHNLSDQFLVGHVFLVAPVYRPSTETRAVYLPAGQWYDYWTDELIEGGKDVIGNAPLDTLPLYCRAGAILPTTDACQYVGERTDLPLYVDVYPGDDGEALLYEDDGLSLRYRYGEFRTTRFRLEARGEVFELSVTPETNGFTPERDSWTLRLHDATADGTVSGEGIVSVSYDPRTRIRECVVRDGERRLVITA